MNILLNMIIEDELDSAKMTMLVMLLNHEEFDFYSETPQRMTVVLGRILRSTER